jgi:hypothetical protein
MMVKSVFIIICAAAIATANALAFSLLRPQTHNISSIFGDALFGVIVTIAPLVGGWFWFIRHN